MTSIPRHQELSDEDVERASLDNLRAAYRSLRDHHVTAAKVLASRAADPEDPSTADHLTDEELATWAEGVNLYDESMKTSYLRMIVDELEDRRHAEVMFAEIDRQFQDVDCLTCDDEGADHCETHKTLVRQWRSARAALCDLARIHRSYLLCLNAPGRGDPK